MFISAAGLTLLAFFGRGTPLAMIIGTFALLGFGFALFSSPNTNAMMSAVQRRDYGVAAGTVGTMRSIGQMLSMGIIMLVFALVIGRVEITPEYYPQFLTSMRIAFAISVAMAILGALFSLARGEIRSEAVDARPETTPGMQR
jgi:MFS family permease